MKLKKLLAVIMAIVMVFSNAYVAMAANGPNDFLGFIELYTYDYSTDVYLIDNFTSNPIGEIKGATYDKSTNTLSLNNFNQPDICITTNTMGDDFKIKLIGENHIQYLGIWGDGHGGSCEFTGSGSLYINENKLYRTAFYMSPEGASSNLKASDNTTIKVYASASGNALYIMDTTDESCIKGNLSVKPNVEKSYYYESIAIITKINSEKKFKVYTKQGSDSKFAVDEREWANNYTIYTIVENPANSDEQIICYYKSGEGSFIPEEWGMIDTEEYEYACTTDYSTYADLWEDSNGNQFVFDRDYDSDLGTFVFKKKIAKEFVAAEAQSGDLVMWYYAEDAGNEAYKTVEEIEAAGYSRSMKVMEGVCSLYIPKDFTLSSGTHTHSYKNVVTKATLTKNGKIVPTCSCGATKAATAVAYPKTIKLSATSFTYDGKVKKPTVTVKDSAGKTIASSNYTVSYASGRKNVGKYSVKITFKGNYSGTKTLYFTINPKGTTISSLKSGKKSMTVKWKKQATQTTGYQIQYSTSSKFTSAKTVTVSSAKTTSKTVKSLKSGKKYYVRIRTYKTVSGAKYYSAWSKAKTVKVK